MNEGRILDRELEFEYNGIRFIVTPVERTPTGSTIRSGAGLAEGLRAALRSERVWRHSPVLELDKRHQRDDLNIINHHTRTKGN